jgi:hypothetical protein
MLEVIPVAMGFLLGWATHSVTSPLRRAAILLGLSVAGALMAALVSGELLRSWACLIFDFAQVAVVGFATQTMFAVLEADSSARSSN